MPCHSQRGWLICSSNTPYYSYFPRYYNLVSPPCTSPPSAALDDIYRFLRISEMGQCSGGPGAWKFGQAGMGSGRRG